MKQLFKRHLESISNRLPLSLSVHHTDGSRQKVGRGGPEVEFCIRRPRVYSSILLNPSLAFGEAYANGGITIPTGNLYEFLRGLWATETNPRIAIRLQTLGSMFRRFSRGNTRHKALHNVQAHYDKFHRIVSLVVDSETRLYSCAFFKQADTALAQAQTAKTARTLAKLSLRPGQTVLDIGCGYGHIAHFAARHYGVRVMGITLSDEQHRVASETAIKQGLAVDVLKTDYRAIPGRFDTAYSVAMYEAVGRKHWAEYFRKVADALKPGGMFLLHTVTQPRFRPMDSLINTHVFPGSELPTPRQVLAAAEPSGFLLHHAESWKPHYARTLLAWYDNLKARRAEVLSLYDSFQEAEWYYRLWEVYLTGCAASFSVEGGMDLHQFVFSKGKADWNAASLEL